MLVCHLLGARYGVQLDRASVLDLNTPELGLAENDEGWAC